MALAPIARASARIRPVLAAATLLAAFASIPLSATDFTVTNTADSGAGSLRQAIADANGATGPHTIKFSIAGSGVHTISPASAYESIVVVEGITIDGTTQPGYAGAPLVEVHGSSGVTCLDFSFTPATVKALVINGCGTAINSGNGGSMTLTGSYIGTDAAGTAAVANGSGVSLVNGAAGNVIGGSAAADRNVIAGNQSLGVRLAFGSSGTIRGNFIGVDATGAAALLTGVGISCESGNGLVVGGSGAGEGNVVVGAPVAQGILLQSCNNAVIRGNRIGTNAAGTAGFGGQRGVDSNLSTGVQIGGPGAGDGNLVSGSGTGIRLNFSDNAVVQGNLIGTDASGLAAVPNVIGIQLSGANAQIGPDAPGGPGANVVAYNDMGLAGTGAGNTIRGNSFHDNRLLGIDLGSNGVSPNDALDADLDTQNFPNVASAAVEGGGVRVAGSLDSTASATFDLDFYEEPACSRFPQDFLEGGRWIGTFPVTTDGSGHAAFNQVLPSVTVSPGFRVTATATNAAGGTSEFSQRIVLQSSPLTGDAAGSQILMGGMQFDAGADVTVGGVAATNVSLLNEFNLQAQAPALPPGSINAIVVTNSAGVSGTLPNGYVSLFSDVDPASPFRPFIGSLVANGLTVGCGGPNYCPANPVTRQQMAVFLLRGKLGLCFSPAPCTGTVFDDVQCAGNTFAPWIEALAGYNITGGCGGDNFCPTNPVNRQQMAVFLLKAKEGSDYVPPACTVATFDDVPCSNPFSSWIYELAARSITGGCGGGNYCPGNVVNRGQMAVFLVKTFGLPQ